MNDNAMYLFLGIALIGLIWMNIMGRRRQRSAVEFRDSLTAGTKVMTTSGMFGTVVSASHDRVVLADQSGGESEWLKAAIARVDSETTPEATPEYPHAPGDEAVPSVSPENELNPHSSTPDSAAPGLLSDDDVRRLGRDN